MMTELTRTNGAPSLTPASVSVLTPDGYKAAMALAQALVESGFLPRAIQKPAQALAIILAGQEYGVPPMQALRQIHIVEGKPTLSAELMLSIFKRRGGRATWVESTDKRAVLRLKHPNGDEHEETFTIEDAQRARVTSKDNWQKYPKPMLRARCISAGIRALGEADGMYDPEELDAEVEPPQLPQSRVNAAAIDAHFSKQERRGPKAEAVTPSLSAVPAASGASEPAESTRGNVNGEPANAAAGEIDADVSRDLVECWTWKHLRGSVKSGTAEGEWVSIGMHPKTTPAQQAQLRELIVELGIEDVVLGQRLRANFSKETIEQLSVEEARDLIGKLEARRAKHGTKADKDARQARRASEAAREMADAVREPGMEG